MTFLHTIPTRGRADRFYIDGRRVSRSFFYSLKHGLKLDTFLTKIDTKRGIIRHYCEGRQA